MNSSRQRDESIERLLRQSLAAPGQAGGTDACLDAETLAAWIDGGLSGPVLERTQLHVADCDRCQSLVGGMARTAVAAPSPRPSAVRRGLAWLVPVTAVATALALWVAVPRESRAPLAPAPAPAELRSDTAAAGPSAQNGLVDQPQAPATAQERLRSTRVPADQAPSAPPTAARALENEVAQKAAKADSTSDNAGPATDALERLEIASAQAPVPPAAPASPEEEPRGGTGTPFSARVGTLSAAGFTSPIEIPSPQPTIRWRILGSAVQRSSDGGSSWESVPTGTTTQLTAGAAPSAAACWLVGRGGLVLRTTDGRTFRRIPFPEVTDLSSVQSTGADQASVTAANGRTFITSDGGVTWTAP